MKSRRLHDFNYAVQSGRWRGNNQKCRVIIKNCQNLVECVITMNHGVLAAVPVSDLKKREHKPYIVVLFVAMTTASMLFFTPIL